jgi:hypothetical protein
MLAADFTFASAFAPEVLTRCCFLMVDDTLPPEAAAGLRLPFAPDTFLSEVASLMSFGAPGRRVFLFWALPLSCAVCISPYTVHSSP